MKNPEINSVESEDSQDQEGLNSKKPPKISRRGFLKVAGAVAGAGLIGSVEGCKEQKKPPKNENKIKKLEKSPESTKERLEKSLHDLEDKVKEFRKLGYTTLLLSRKKGAPEDVAQKNFKSIEDFDFDMLKRINFVKYRIENNFRCREDEGDYLFAVLRPNPCTPEQLFSVIESFIKTTNENIDNMRKIRDALDAIKK
jgi:hypothetical protein